MTVYKIYSNIQNLQVKYLQKFSSALFRLYFNCLYNIKYFNDDTGIHSNISKHYFFEQPSILKAFGRVSSSLSFVCLPLYVWFVKKNLIHFFSWLVNEK